MVKPTPGSPLPSPISYLPSKALLILLLVALLGMVASAQLQVEASVDTYTVREGESINLTVSVDAQAGDVSPELPQIDGFDVYETGSNFQQTIVNGQVSTRMALTYTMIAKKAGRYTIGPIKVALGGQQAETQPIDVEVLPPNHPLPGTQAQTQTPSATQSPTAHPQGFEPAPPGLDNTKSAFVTAEVDRSNPYLNQQITYILKLYLAAAPIGPCGYEPPETTGFLVEELLPHSRTYPTEVDGRPYYVVEERTALFATSPGQHSLNPARVRVTLQQMVQSVFAADPFGYSVPEEMTLSTDRVDVDVRSLPTEGRPADFGGAVGDYAMEAALDKTTVAAGQPVNLTVTVSGQGNVNLISPVALPALKKFRVYDTTSTSNVQKKDYEVTGTRTFRTVLVPLEEGRQKIEGLKFSYFDPEAEQYKTIEAPAITLDVTPGKVSKRDEGKPVQDKLAGPKTSLGTKPLGFQPPTWLGLLQALPLLAVAFVLGLASFRRWREASSSERRQSLALRRAKRELKKLRSVNAVDGGKVVLSAVHGFFSDRLGLTTFGLSLEELDRLLAERGLAPELRAHLRAELEAAEEARYAPAGQTLATHEKTLCRVLFEIEEAL